MTNFIAALVVALVVALLVFLAFRAVWLWYWRIDTIVSRLTEIRDSLRVLERRGSTVTPPVNGLAATAPRPALVEPLPPVVLPPSPHRREVSKASGA